MKTKKSTSCQTASYNYLKQVIKSSITDICGVKVVSAPVDNTATRTALSDFLKKVRKLRNENNELNNQIEDLSEMFFGAASSSNEKKIMQLLEERLDVLKEANADLEAAKTIQIQAEKRFGDNKSALKAMKEINSLVEACEITKDNAQTLLNDMAHTQRPAALTNKDTLTDSVVKFIMSSFKDSKAKPKPELLHKSSQYTLAFSPKAIRFARFMPMVNLPTVEGTTKNLYFVLMVDLFGAGSDKGKLVSSRISNLSITLSDNIKEPTQLNNIYVVKDLRAAKDVLTFLSDKYGIIMFGDPISGDPEVRREKVIEHLNILKDKDIKIKLVGNMVKLKIPMDKIELDVNDKIIPEVEKQMYQDVARLVGLKTTSKYNTRRLKLIKQVEKDSFFFMTYMLLPTDPAFTPDTNKDNAGRVGRTSTKPGNKNTYVRDEEDSANVDKEFREQDFSDAIANLKEAAKDWLS